MPPTLDTHYYSLSGGRAGAGMKGSLRNEGTAYALEATHFRPLTRFTFRLCTSCPSAAPHYTTLPLHTCLSRLPLCLLMLVWPLLWPCCRWLASVPPVAKGCAGLRPSTALRPPPLFTCRPYRATTPVPCNSLGVCEQTFRAPGRGALNRWAGWEAAGGLSSCGGRQEACLS